jgi:hypothetical protein
MAAKIKIFMCAHREVSLIPPLTLAIQGGAAANAPIKGAIPDFGMGGSISEKNPDYCELTVQYYAWKNEAADYYGFCHYRRFFSFDESIKAPYLALGKPNEKNLSRVLFSEERMRSIIEKYDVIAPRKENMGRDVYSQYASIPSCRKDDIHLFESVIAKKFPSLSPFAKEYLEGNEQYFCNMFIMKRDIFFDYCEKLFALLVEFDAMTKPNGKLRYDRVDGYLAERFFGIYLASLRAEGAKIGELCRIDVDCTLKKRILARLFPPESKIRFLAKKIFNPGG